jgi:hypothetical protein
MVVITFLKNTWGAGNIALRSNMFPKKVRWKYLKILILGISR